MSGLGPKQLGSVDIEKQIESERCHKRWISGCTCLVPPQILSTNSLPTSNPSSPLYRTLSISPAVGSYSPSTNFPGGERGVRYASFMHPGCGCNRSSAVMESRGGDLEQVDVIKT